MGYTGNYTNVSITRNGTAISGATNITGTTFTDTGLTAHTSYTYVITPNNSAGAGTTSSLTMGTLPVLTSLSVSSETSSQTVLLYSGSYTNVSITRNGTAISGATNITGTTFTDTGLSANTSYTYVVTPNNSSGSGTSLTTINVTLPNITTAVSVSSFTSSQIVLVYAGNYTNVSITRNGTAISGATNITGTTYTDTGLTGFTSYVYVVTPKNSDGEVGTSSTITQVTSPVLTSLSTTATTSTTISLAYTGSYAQVDISRNGTFITSATGTSLIDAGLTANTLYTYYVTPTNGGGLSGGLYFTIYNGYHNESVTFTSTAALRTTGLLALNTGYNSNISDINVGTNGAIPIDGSLSSYTVEWFGYFLANVTGTWTFFTNSDDGSYLWMDSSALSGNYTTTNAIVKNGGGHAMVERSGTISLTSGTYYPIRILFGESGGGDNLIVSFTPPSGTKTTNGSGYYFSGSLITTKVSGTALTTTSRYTLPSITTLSASTSTTATTITLTYTGLFTTVSITRNGTSIATGITALTYTDSGLTANTSYVYILTPYNPDGTTAGSTSSVTRVTLISGTPTIGTATTLSTSTASVSYTGVSGTATTTYTATSSPGSLTGTGVSPITVAGLIANTTYTFTVTATNTSGTSSASSASNSVLTLPSLTTLSSASTSTSITLTYTGLFTNVSITRNGTSIATGITALTYTDSGLTLDSSYTYIVSPYNSNGIIGTTLSLTAFATTYTSFEQLLVNKSPWGKYSASSWNSGTNILTDLTGNGRNATTTNVSSGTASGNGATASIPYIGGTTTGTVLWPTSSIGSTFTLATITRYSGTTKGRVLHGVVSNWLHGHWSGLRGVAFYEGWKTAQTSVGTQTDWLNMVGTNSTSVSIPNNIIANGTSRGTANGGSGSDRLRIGVSESSDFQFSHTFIWNQGLTQAELGYVSSAYTSYLSNGIESALSVPTPIAPIIGTATVLTSTSVIVAFTLQFGSTSYTVTSSPGSLTGTGTTSPITVSGLTTGTAYTFTMTSTNSTGTSPASSVSNSVTP